MKKKEEIIEKLRDKGNELEIPSSLHPEWMEETLKEHEQKQYFRKGRLYPALAAAASFEEKEGYDPQTSSVNDSNMSIQPQADWEMEGMLNPFAWVEEFFTALIEEAEGTQPEPADTREGLMERISRPGGRR